MKKIFAICILIASISCSSLQHDASSPLIQLTKKRCMGKCPVYDLMIYKNGLVTYNGIDHVSKKGLHQFQIPSEKMNELSKLFDRSGFKEIESPKRKGRDIPVTQLTYEDKTLSFQGRIPKDVNNIIVALELIVEM